MLVFKHVVKEYLLLELNKDEKIIIEKGCLIYSDGEYDFENKIEEAEKIIDLLFEFETNNSEIIIQKSRILSKRKKHTDSISLLKKIKKDCEFYSDALIMIGKEYLFIDDFENAKEKFKEYINDYQLDYAVLNNLLFIIFSSSL